jgi:transmembrane sensor
MSHEIPRGALSRYLAGDSSPEEAERVRAWLERHPEARLAFDGVDELPDDYLARRDPEAAVRRMEALLGDDEPARLRAAAHPPQPARIYFLPHYAFRIAAAFLVMGLVGLLAYRSSLQTDAPAHSTEYATAPGQRATVTLDDGTTVQLNVASRLLASPSSNGTERVVHLDGEAFFDVVSDPDRPFVVVTSSARVRVLGTSFNLYARTAEPGVAVVVVEGRVALQPVDAAGSAGAEVVRGQLGRLTNGSVQVEHVDPAQLMAWRSGRLVFAGTPLSSVAREIERWYDVEVVLDDDIAALRLDASFQDEPLDDVLETISLALGLSFRVDGRRVMWSR